MLHLGHGECGVGRAVGGQVAGEVVKALQDFEVGCDQSLSLARSLEARESVTSRGPNGKLGIRPGWSSRLR